LGASIEDTTILKYMKGGLKSEIDALAQTKFAKRIARIPGFSHPWFVSILGVVVLSSPLPDELGALLIAEGNRIQTKYFTIISFISNTIGIYILTKALDFLITH
jgi:surface polysaccharide O-acyltransferase-like enzyme